MPKLLEETVVDFETRDLLARRPIKRPDKPPHRAKGVHVSGVLEYCARQAGYLKPGEKFEDLIPQMWIDGIAWEEFIASMYPGWRWQPGERTVDGISMNCDGLSKVGTLKPWIEEAKATRHSSRHLRGNKFLTEPKNWMRIQQGAAYCHGYGPRLVRWHMRYLNGPYDWETGPQYIRYLVEFSDAEVAQTWAMITSNRDKAVPE